MRAAVDLHCLGLTYPQLHAASAAQSSAAAESELSHGAAAFAAAEPCQIPGPEAAGRLVPGALPGQQMSVEVASFSHGHESPSETATICRSARLQSAFGAAAGVARFGLSPNAGISQSSAACADSTCLAMVLFVSQII